MSDQGEKKDEYAKPESHNVNDDLDDVSGGSGSNQCMAGISAAACVGGDDVGGKCLNGYHARMGCTMGISG
jgi:hypothetical protein